MSFNDILALRDPNMPFAQDKIEILEKYYIKAYGSLNPFSEETKGQST